MVTMGRPKAELTLSDKERVELRLMLRRRSTPQALALRARIVLMCGASSLTRSFRSACTACCMGLRWNKSLLMRSP